MKYKVGETVRVRRDLRHGERIPFGVTEDMAAMAGAIVTISEAIEGSPDKYRLEEDRDGYSWCEQMFEPVPQFSSGIISLSNDPRLSDMEATLQGFGLRENANEVRDTQTRGASVFKPMLDSISMLSALEKCISLSVESEFGTKKRTGIESRKDIRKRLLKL